MLYIHDLRKERKWCSFVWLFVTWGPILYMAFTIKLSEDSNSVHLLHYIKKLVTFFFFCSICSKIPINDLWPTFQNTQIEEVLAVDCREVDSGTGKGYSQHKAREAFLYCMIETPNFVATKSGKSATIAMKQKLPWSMTTFHNAAAKLSLGCASHTSCTKFPRGQAELPQVTLTCQSRCLKTVSIPYKMKNPITII